MVSSTDGISIGSTVLSSTASGINTGAAVTAIDTTTPALTFDNTNPSIKSGTIVLKRLDGQGNLVALSPTGKPNAPTYFGPDYFTFGASTYVPTYDDAIFLSKSSGRSQTGKINYPPYALSGICKYYENDKAGLEKACSLIDKNTCASTSCCLLMGGNTCVSGNKRGAYYPKNFTSDFYFYNGDCYGNCR